MVRFVTPFLPDKLMLLIWDVNSLRELILADLELPIAAEPLSPGEGASLVRTWLLKLVRRVVRKLRLSDPQIIEMLACKVVFALGNSKVLIRYRPSQAPLAAYVSGVVYKVGLEQARKQRRRQVDTLRFTARTDIAENPLDWACREEVIEGVRTALQDFSEDERFLFMQKHRHVFGAPKNWNSPWSKDEEHWRLFRLHEKLAERLTRYLP